MIKNIKNMCWAFAGAIAFYGAGYFAAKFLQVQIWQQAIFISLLTIGLFAIRKKGG